MKTTMGGLGPAVRRVAGIREAKGRLSELLRDVQFGHEWTITERGRPIAKISPVDGAGSTLHERLARLERCGILDAARPIGKTVPPALRVPTGLARRMLEDREG